MPIGEDERLAGTLALNAGGTYDGTLAADISVQAPARCYGVSTCGAVQAILNRNRDNAPMLAAVAG